MAVNTGERPDDSVVSAMIGMARAQHKLGDDNTAQNTLKQAYDYAQGRLPSEFLLALAEIKAGQGDHANALALLDQARQDPKLNAQALTQIGEITSRAENNPRPIKR